MNPKITERHKRFLITETNELLVRLRKIINYIENNSFSKRLLNKYTKILDESAKMIYLLDAKVNLSDIYQKSLRLENIANKYTTFAASRVIAREIYGLTREKFDQMFKDFVMAHPERVDLGHGMYGKLTQNDALKLRMGMSDDSFFFYALI